LFQETSAASSAPKTGSENVLDPDAAAVAAANAAHLRNSRRF
jgi:hypothetical protein